MDEITAQPEPHLQASVIGFCLTKHTQLKCCLHARHVLNVVVNSKAFACLLERCWCAINASDEAILCMCSLTSRAAPGRNNMPLLNTEPGPCYSEQTQWVVHISNDALQAIKLVCCVTGTRRIGAASRASARGAPQQGGSAGGGHLLTGTSQECCRVWTVCDSSVHSHLTT